MIFRHLLALALSWPCICLAEPLAMEEAARLATLGQPLLQGQQAAVQAETERAVAAGELPDPRLKLGLLNVPYAPFSLTREPMTQAMVSVEQVFPGGDKRRLRGEVAEAGVVQRQAESLVIDREIRRDVSMAWLQTWYAQRAGAMLVALQNEYDYQVDAERIRLASGRGEQRDVLAARLQLDYLRDRAAELNGEEAAARLELARWIGRDAERELVAALPMPKVEPATSHPQIAALDKSILTLEKEVALAQEAVKSDWTMEVGYGARGAGQSDMLSVQFGFDLPLAPAARQDRQTAAKLAELEAMRARREDSVRLLKTGLQKAQTEQRTLQARIERFLQTILPATAQRTAATLISYRNGRAELAAVIEARRAELDAGLQLLALQVAAAKAAVQSDYYASAGEQP